MKDLKVRRDPANLAVLPSILGFRQGIDKLFDEMWNGFGLATGRGASEEFMPSVDVKENEKSVVITAELPGIDEKDIDVSFSGDSLVIKGEKHEEKIEEREDVHYTERSYGSFIRTIPVPIEVDADKVSASFKKGVLTITCPKSKATVERARRIAIKS